MRAAADVLGGQIVSEDAPQRMPAAFIGHGSPMNTLERNRYTDAWATLGRTVPRPRAILCVSAHWYIGYTGVTAMPQPRVIHDFFGFPDELFAFDYPAPGAPEVAEMVADVAKPHWVGQDAETWGLDHGTWSVLAHMFPDADVPVVQLSLNATKPAEYHLDLATRLAPLRDEGVLVVASGNVVHNLRRIDWKAPHGGTDWAQRFDEQARELMASSPADTLDLLGHRDVDMAVPTPDHFLPLLYLAGLADADAATADVLVEGYAYGSLSMTAWTLGVTCEVSPTVEAGSAPLADPDVVPPDDSNV